MFSPPTSLSYPTRRLNEIGESDGFAQGAPEIAVEIISPNDRYTEVEEKVEDWLNAGCRAVIVANPRRRTVNLHRSPTDVTDPGRIR